MMAIRMPGFVRNGMQKLQRYVSGPMATPNRRMATYGMAATAGAIALGTTAALLWPKGDQKPQNVSNTNQAPQVPQAPKTLKESNPVNLSQTAQLANTEKTTIPGFKSPEACKNDPTCTRGVTAIMGLKQAGVKGVEPPIAEKAEIKAARKLDSNSYQYEVAEGDQARQFTVTNPGIKEQKVVELTPGQQPVLQVPGDATNNAKKQPLTFGNRTQIAAVNDNTYELIDTTNVKGTPTLQKSLGTFANVAEFGRSRQTVLSTDKATATQKAGIGSQGTNFAAVPIKQGDKTGTIVALENPNGQASYKLFLRDDAGSGQLVKNGESETFGSLEDLLKANTGVEVNPPQTTN